MEMWEFLERYFIDPIKYNQGYNVVNTLVYALILGVAVILLYEFLKRLGVRVNEKFFLSLMPYIFLGPLMRAMTDKGILPRTYLTVSPGGYFVIAGFAIAALLIVWKHVGAGEVFYPLYRDVGFLLLGGLLFLLIINAEKVTLRVSYFKYFIPAFMISELFIWALSKKVKLVRDNALLFYTHFYDATTTFVGIKFFGYWEQHVLARTLIDLTGSAAVMYLEKLLILFPVVYILDNLMGDEDPELINFVKLAMFILGFGPGTRNLLIALMEV